MNNLNYKKKSDSYFSENRPEMVKLLPIDAKVILEVGCGSGGFAGNLKSIYNVHITGIEPFAMAAAQARTKLDHVIQLPVDDAIELLSGRKFDCIVCNDVLEHLVDPWQTLQRLKNLLSEKGVVVASLPNMRFMPVLKDLFINGNWHYVDVGVMDRTHLRFFTKKSILQLFEESGYAIKHLEGINSISLPWKFSLMNKVFLGRFEDCKYQQYACVAAK